MRVSKLKHKINPSLTERERVALRRERTELWFVRFITWATIAAASWLVWVYWKTPL